MNSKMILSTLPKTWIFDLDGTILKHNGYKIDGYDSVLSGVKEYLSQLPECDKIIILTARTLNFKDSTITFLKENNIRYDNIIFGVPVGERILVNDKKESGLITSYSINLERNSFNMPEVLRLI